jgi:hypothetical protein
VLHRVADAVSRHCLSRRANLALCSKKEKVQLQHFNISIMMGRPSVSQKHSSIPSIISEYIAPSHRETTSAKDNYSVCAVQFPLFFSFFAIRHIIDYGWCLVWGKKKIKRKKWNPPSARRRRRRHLICNSLRNHFSFPIEIQCRFHLKSIVCLRRNGDHESQATEQMKNTPRTSRKIHRKRVV